MFSLMRRRSIAAERQGYRQVKESKKLVFHTQGDQLTDPKETSQSDEKQAEALYWSLLDAAVRVLTDSARILARLGYRVCAD